MALRSKSLFLYGLEVTSGNNKIDFQTTMAGPIYTGTVALGFYSLTSLLAAIASAMKVADPVHSFYSTADRTVNDGTENRVSIGTTHTFLSILFGSGPNALTSIGSLIGFLSSDYTGDTEYEGSSSAGIPLVPDWFGTSYQPPEVNLKNFGAVNVSASGEKESIVWAIQRFIIVTFPYEPGAIALVDWPDFIEWAIKQKPFDFTPEISLPSIVYDVTLEKTPQDGKGLAWALTEMLPNFPFTYTTGAITMRVRGS